MESSSKNCYTLLLPNNMDCIFSSGRLDVSRLDLQQHPTESNQKSNSSKRRQQDTATQEPFHSHTHTHPINLNVGKSSSFPGKVKFINSAFTVESLKQRSRATEKKIKN